MKVAEAIKILTMFDPNTEVELVFPDAQEVKVSPVKPKPKLTEGEMAMMPMYPSEQEWYKQHIVKQNNF